MNMMPLSLDMKLLALSDRIKYLDLHSVKPWMLVSLCNGNVYIWNYETQQMVKSFEVGDLHVCAAKIVVHPTQPFILTSDDCTCSFLYPGPHPVLWHCVS